MDKNEIPKRSWRKDGPLLLVSFLLGLVAATLCGCATSSPTGMKMPWTDKPDRADGIVAPHERIEELQKLEKEGPKASPQTRQNVSSRLVAEYQREGDPMIRCQIIRTLGAYPTESSATVLRHALADPDPEVRMIACQAWGKRADAEAIQRLGEQIRDDADDNVRLAAVKALGETKQADAVQSIAPALEDSNPALQRRAVLALKEVSDKDFGYDVVRWHQWATNRTVEPPQKMSVAERMKSVF